MEKGPGDEVSSGDGVMLSGEFAGKTVANALFIEYEHYLSG